MHGAIKLNIGTQLGYGKWQPTDNKTTQSERDAEPHHIFGKMSSYAHRIWYTKWQWEVKWYSWQILPKGASCPRAWLESFFGKQVDITSK